ncbi:MAG TPA: SGNH/GDSL hydrolase family protein [Planctomycetota bacterium]|mgnify:CR=1 FL=1|nr:SGNH/GDSL hydrolase family protein [Planctomycetota bacterium]HRR81147.1 SGNH/GDSL hydrolase family protein [Planctomycetota bacterium]HRT97265.1 SGNH/GDSL hydrolase family protein [Planctomycetota bacterium]
MRRRVATGLWLVLVVALACFAGEAKLQDGDLVAVTGDSITEQKQYSVFIEDYLLMCQPAAKLRVMQFGWGGETAGGFRNRMANDCLPFKPTVATTCYGMNDGGYRPFDENQQGRSYRESTRAIVQEFKKAGVRLIVVGSPGVVDADTFRHDPAAARMYNETLARLRDIAREVAEKEGVVFGNVFDPMMDAMTKAKAKYGKDYHVAGGDGVHPGANGQLLMAYAFLKALGCDGNIGTITVDLAAGKAEATEGHKVLACKDGAVELESTRYPFCFFGDPKDPNATSGIIEFVPFNQDLNRLTLVVKGARGDRVKVTWGKASKEFAAADLAKGVNLAAELLDNPFCDAFKKVDAAVRAQQNFETPMIKDLINKLPSMQRLVPEEKEAFERVRTALARRNQELFDAAAAAVVPVKHAIKIE